MSEGSSARLPSGRPGLAGRRRPGEIRGQVPVGSRSGRGSGSPRLSMGR